MADDDGDPCAALGRGDDTEVGLHVAAVFIVLFASALGTCLPMLARVSKHWGVAYLIALGKSTGIGIVLACALVHLLQPANEALTSPCLPPVFGETYPAFAYMFALLGILMMQLMDNVLAHLAWQMHRGYKQVKIAHAPDSFIDDSALSLVKTASIDVYGSTCAGSDAMAPTHTNMASVAQPYEAEAGVSHAGHGHMHGVPYLPPDASAKRILAAYMLEFGIASHSVFIGLAVGVASAASLRALLVALVFHQFFEGLALGARIVDAGLPSRWHEAWLVIIFSVSAPLGISIGIGVASTLNTNSPSFLLVQGVMDALSAGLLLYIGFTLLQQDFAADLAAHVRTGADYAVVKRVGLFSAMWMGAGLMSFIGLYL